MDVRGLSFNDDPDHSRVVVLDRERFEEMLK